MHVATDTLPRKFPNPECLLNRSDNYKLLSCPESEYLENSSCCDDLPDDSKLSKFISFFVFLNSFDSHWETVPLQVLTGILVFEMGNIILSTMTCHVLSWIPMKSVGIPHVCTCLTSKSHLSLLNCFLSY